MLSRVPCPGYPEMKQIFQVMKYCQSSADKRMPSVINFQSSQIVYILFCFIILNGFNIQNKYQ